MPVTLLALSVLELGTLGTLAIAAVAVLSALKVLPGQRAELRISRDQGAAKIRDDFISTLQRELERKNAEQAQLRAEIAELRTENAGLRRRAGTRKSDPSDTDDTPAT